MSVPVAYATMLIIWSTTPIGINWSNETLSPITALSLRMSIATVLGLLLLRALNMSLLLNRRALLTYGYSLFGVYGAMVCVYFAARSIPSGLISLLFATSPVLTSLLATKLLGTGSFSVIKKTSFALSFLGLLIVCGDDWVLRDNSVAGISLLALGVSLYSLSGILVQKSKFEGHPLSLTVGTLLTSMPLFLATWLFLDGELPVVDWTSKSPWAVLYLAVFGSLIGFVAYFHVLNKLGAIAVAMVTLMTPALALALGNLMNEEPITSQMVFGTTLVIIGLGIFYQEDSA